MCSSSVLGPIAQDIPEQDIVMGELELPPQMDPKPEMAAVHDTSPPLLRNPPLIPAETAQPSALDIILRAMEANTDEMKEMRGEMRQIGRGLQAGTARMLAITGKMATPRAATNELEGSAPALQSFGSKVAGQVSLRVVMGEEPAHRDVLDVGVISLLVLLVSYVVGVVGVIQGFPC